MALSRKRRSTWNEFTSSFFIRNCFYSFSHSILSRATLARSLSFYLSRWSGFIAGYRTSAIQKSAYADKKELVGRKSSNTWRRGRQPNVLCRWLSSALRLACTLHRWKRERARGKKKWFISHFPTEHAITQPFFVSHDLFFTDFIFWHNEKKNYVVFATKISINLFPHSKIQGLVKNN